MCRRLALAVSIAVNLHASSSSAEDMLFEPSFGLSWGMSPEDFTSRFDVIKREDSDGLLVLMSGDKSGSLPRNTDFLQAMFWKNRLVKFSWASDNFEGDLFGREGKEAYDTIGTTLEQKLGAGDKTEIVGLELWNEPDEFYQCLAYDGCGAWVTFWVNPTNEHNLAMLQLNGLDRGEGYLKYTVEHPDWTSYQEDRTTGDASKF